MFTPSGFLIAAAAEATRTAVRVGDGLGLFLRCLSLCPASFPCLAHPTPSAPGQKQKLQHCPLLQPPWQEDLLWELITVSSSFTQFSPHNQILRWFSAVPCKPIQKCISVAVIHLEIHIFRNPFKIQACTNIQQRTSVLKVLWKCWGALDRKCGKRTFQT